MKNVLLVNTPLTLLFLSDIYGGRTHDKRIADATPYPLAAGSQLLQALGFLAFALPDVEMLMPTRKPRGQELALEEQLANQALHHRRLRIEHVNSSVKLSHCARPAALVEEGHPRFDDGTVLCPAQLPGASGPLAAHDLIGINSEVSRTKRIPLTEMSPFRLLKGTCQCWVLAASDYIEGAYMI